VGLFFSLGQNYALLLLSGDFFSFLYLPTALIFFFHYFSFHPMSKQTPIAFLHACTLPLQPTAPPRLSRAAPKLTRAANHSIALIPRE